MKRQISLFAAFLLIAISGCKKEKHEPDTGTTTTPPGFTIDKTEGQPGSLVSIKCDCVIDTAQIKTTIADSTIKVWKVDDHTVAFVLPESVPTGSQAVDIAMGDQHISSAFTVLPTSSESPDIILKEFTDAADAALSEINYYKANDTGAYNIHSEDIEALNQMIEEWKKQVDAMSAKDRQALAMIISANGLSTSIKGFDFLGTKFEAANRLSLSENSDEIFREGKRFVRRSIELAALIGLASLTAVSPEPFSKIVTLSSAIGIGVKFMEARDSAIRIVDLMCLPENFDLQKNGSSLRTSLSPTYSFYNKRNTTMPVGMNFATLSSSDLNSPSSFIKQLATTVKAMEDKYKNLASLVNSFTGWFSWSKKPTLAPWNETLKSTPVSEYGDINGKYLSIKNVSNSNIKLTLSVSGEEPVIYCQSSLTQETNFTFDLVYSNPNIGTSLTQKVNGTFKLTPKIIHETVELTYSQSSPNGYLFTVPLMIEGSKGTDLAVALSSLTHTNASFNDINLLCNGSTVSSIKTNSTSTILKPFSAGATISKSSLNWESCGNANVIGSYTVNTGTVRKSGELGTTFYLAFRFSYSGQVYYGWLRMSTASNAANFTIHEYAYNTEPDKDINTGQTE